MVQNFKSYFPIFKKHPELIYLDNAATTQRPQEVIDSITNFYSFQNSSTHRGIYDLSIKATEQFEEVRKKAAHLINAKNPESIAFTKGTTDAINIVANGFLKNRLKNGDNIVTTIMEHHANFIPWQMAAKVGKAELRVVTVDQKGDLDLENLDELLDKRTKLLAATHISNTIGTINDLQKIIELAHKKDVPVLIDAAQSAAYYELNQQQLEYDFLTFSGHKLFGPFGTGILFVAEKFIEDFYPGTYGGGIIMDVTLQETTFLKYPYNQDAGTPNVGGIIGLGAAIDFVQKFDKKEVQSHMQEVIAYAEEELKKINGVQLIGQPNKRSGILSFTMDDIHAHDVATFLNKDHIAVRAGMHCTQPLLDKLGLPATVRISLAPYNDKEDINKLVNSLKELIKFWL